MKNSKLLSEAVKIDIALASQSLNGAGTGQYYKLDEFGKGLFIVSVGAMAAGVTSILQVMQAQDAAGTGAKPVANNAATITANTRVNAITLTIADAAAGVHVAGDKVTINGLVFTAGAADGGASSRTYAVGADGATSAANLFAKISSSVVGVPGVSASIATVGANSVITIVADEPGKTTITAVASAATTTVATLSAIGYVECDASYLDDRDGFTHVALQVTNSAATPTGAVLLSGQGRFSPAQKVAAAKTDVNP